MQHVKFRVKETPYEYIFTTSDYVELPLPEGLKKDKDLRRIFTAKLIMSGNSITAIVIEKK